MSFKNMKRDDHGHVIGNDEQDGQKCQHGAGGSGNKNWQKKDTPGADVYEREVNGEKHIALKSKNDGSIHYFKGNTAKTEEVDGFEDSPFDDDYEEEFNEPDEAKGPYNDVDFNWVKDHIEDNPGIGADELVEHVKEKFGDINPEDEVEIRGLLGKKELSLEDAINMADDDVLDEQFGKDTPERKLAGAMKIDDPSIANNLMSKGYSKKEAYDMIKSAREDLQEADMPAGPKEVADYMDRALKDGHFKKPAGEATTKEEWTKRHNDFLERGKSTWNQKLMKGDKVTFEGKDGKDIEGYIGGFWNGGKLTDEDAYEEGKDNNWHDFRGVGIVDKDGKELGSINAYQIKTHGREAKPTGTQVFDNLKKYVNSLSDDEKEMLKDLLNNPRK